MGPSTGPFTADLLTPYTRKSAGALGNINKTWAALVKRSHGEVRGYICALFAAVGREGWGKKAEFIVAV